MNIISNKINAPQSKLKLCKNYENMHLLFKAFDAVADWRDKYNDNFSFCHFSAEKINRVISKIFDTNTKDCCSWFELLRSSYAVIIASGDMGRYSRDARIAIESAAKACCSKSEAEEIIYESPYGLGYYLLKLA